MAATATGVQQEHDPASQNQFSAGIPVIIVTVLTALIGLVILIAATIACGLSPVGLLLLALTGQSLLGISLTSIVFVAGISITVPRMLSLFGQMTAPNIGGGMALAGFVIFIGSGAIQRRTQTES